MHILSREPLGPSFPGKWLVRPPLGLRLPVRNHCGVETETKSPARAHILLGGNELHENLSQPEPVPTTLQKLKQED